MARILEWSATPSSSGICQSSSLWPVWSGWPCKARLTASLNYASSIVIRRLWSTTNLDNVLKSYLFLQRDHFADRGPYSQNYGFSSSHVWMWRLDHKEGWVLRNWCFQIVVLEKTLESSLDCEEINLKGLILKEVNLKGNQPWIFIGGTVAKAETPIIWPSDARSWLTGKDPDAAKDWRQKEKGEAEEEMVR